MGNEDYVEVQGTVVEPLPSAKFKIMIDDEEYPQYNGTEVTAHLSGKMRMHYIKILPGDKVTLEVNIYDPTKGRITFRHKQPR